jgi:hypothetical protein
MDQELRLYETIGYTRDTLEGNDISLEAKQDENPNGEVTVSGGGVSNHGVPMNNVEVGVGLANEHKAGITRVGLLYSRGFSGRLDYNREYFDQVAGKKMGITFNSVRSSRLGFTASHFVGASQIDMPSRLHLGISYSILFPLPSSDLLPVAYTQEDGSTGYDQRRQKASQRGMLGLDVDLVKHGRLSTGLLLEAGLALGGTIDDTELSTVGSISLQFQETLKNSS